MPGQSLRANGEKITSSCQKLFVAQSWNHSLDEFRIHFVEFYEQFDDSIVLNISFLCITLIGCSYTLHCSIYFTLHQDFLIS